MRCIFCHESEKEFKNGNSWSKEHIIPYALGNHSLKIYNVCQKCNSGLGSNVDAYVNNHFLIAIIRQSLKLKSEEGNIPNPFATGKDDEGNIIRVSDDFELSMEPVPKVNDGVFKLQATDRESAKKVIKTKLDRKGFDEKEIDSIMKTVDITPSMPYQPNVRYDFTIEPARFELEIIKIAYEYAITKLNDDYSKDPRAEELRVFLNKAINGEMKNKCDQISGIASLNNDERLANMLRQLSILHAHYLQFSANKEGNLLLIISLFMEPCLTYIIKISDNASLYTFPKQSDIIEITS